MISEIIAKANFKDNTEIYLLGDFNINLKNKRDPAAKELLFVTGVLGLKPIIKDMTKRGGRTDGGAAPALI